MRKVLGLALTTVLLLSFTSCTEQGQNNNNGARTATANTPASTATANANASAPTTPTTTPTPPAPTTATVKNDGFSWRDDASGTPVTTIKVGGTVTWTTTPGAPHSLKGVAPSPDNGCNELEASFNTGNLSPGQPVTRTFDKVGTYGYQCGIHGGTPNCTTPPGSGRMPGVIKVVP